MKREWRILEDAGAVARKAADFVLERAAAALREERGFRIVLAGGRTPEATYAHLAESGADWTRWEVFFGDERCLPPEHPERNSRMAARVWLDRVEIPQERIHPIPAETGPERAAEVYAGIVAAALPFHLVMLGMGEDGHTASLFPGRSFPEGRLAVPVFDAPKPPSERVSLGYRALRATREQLILVTGAAKAEAVRRWREGEDDLPIARASAGVAATVLLDRAAAGRS